MRGHGECGGHGGIGLFSQTESVGPRFARSVDLIPTETPAVAGVPTDCVPAA
jgi:hypothetical protein